ncbi:hypothetical protein SAMN05216294_2304 [Flagellimonas zhangzhouensis]|uniref:Uncharacterized protein n=1 Tax=Flagellimonas zhangzhouensis TaxID=1073328 RepID=A0A1H2S7W4_9FLAO|nr:hypothetical protein SAMN05216294_2304 [Allomuricauda zhangzhouensis]SDW27244.1 hypothetical protein SAMN04487892_0951 [Allomuricauda zhangzhouensis]
MKNPKIVDAVIIGFLCGIIIWSIVSKTWGFLTLIPLFLIYKLINKPKEKK